MNSIQRVKRAIHFKGVDRIPHYLPDGGQNDILWFWFPGPEEKMPWIKISERVEERVDEWGVLWQRGEPGSYGEAKDFPIKDIVHQAEYLFPDLNNPQYFTESKRTIEENSVSKNPKYCLGVMPFNSLNEGTHNIIGLDRMFMAYYDQPGALKSLIARLAESQRQSIRRLAEIGCHGVMGYDDWGLQDRQMVGNDLIEEYFMPHYRENWTLAHDLGMDVWLHSCGHILDVLPLLIGAGLDVIQMDQQENIGLENLDASVGGKICFWCPVDVQKTMVNGNAEDIKNYVKRMMTTIGNHGGGLISKAYPSPEAVGHSAANTDAMCKAFRAYGEFTVKLTEN